jgi:rRNA small subunit pseudouridine methyltransferase Nep1
MGRTYAVKGRKRKKPKLHEAAATDAVPPAEEAEELPPLEEPAGEDKGKDEEAAAGGDEEEHAAAEGLPVVPRPVGVRRPPGAIFVLERACLEVGKVGKVRWLGLARNCSVSLCCSTANSCYHLWIIMYCSGSIFCLD